MTTKTAQAIALVDAGAGPVAAAAQAGISYHVLYRALKRRADKPICPCCKQVVRKGFEVTPAPAAVPAAVPEPVEPEALALRPAMAGVRAAVSSRDATTRAVIKRELAGLLAQLDGGK